MSFTYLKMLLRKRMLTTYVIGATLIAFYALMLVVMYLMGDMMADILGGVSGMFDGEEMVQATAPFVGGDMIMMLMLFTIIYCHGLVSKSVDNKCTATYLTAGISRTKYITTGWVFMTVMMVAMYVLVFVTGIIGSAILGWEYSILHFLNTLFLSLLLNLAIASILWLLAVVFAGRRGALGYLIMIAVGLYLYNIIARLVAELVNWLNWIHYLTPYGWLDYNQLMEGTFTLWWMWALIYIAIIASTFVGSVLIFRKRQLSL